MLDFGRDLCSQPALAHTREWLVTNGLGGYAAGTVSGVITRRYHGLLVAALRPPVSRALLVTKLDETASYDGRPYALFANHWADGSIEPPGYIHLERFHLEGTTPVWTYALADARLEKRVWMRPGANTTYVQYTLRQASLPLSLNLKALLNDRDHHGNTLPGRPPLAVTLASRGLRVALPETGARLELMSDRADVRAVGVWFSGYFLAVEAGRGEPPLDANFHAADFAATLRAGETLTLTASTEAEPPAGEAARAEQQAHEQELLSRSGLPADAPPAVRQWVLAADQFIVRRALPAAPEGRTIIAGYPWFTDWGRDTMISLPGLTLATRRFEVAAQILRTFAHFVDRGMLPNHFPDAGETPEYNTVDATLWYFEALRAYQAATGDAQLAAELFPVLADIIDWHVRGTRYGIHLDAADGLLAAGEPGVQLTWMDVKIDDWVVTPRTGKAVEVNALWHNALRAMSVWARQLGLPAEPYSALADRARAGFARFWNAPAGYCFDVLDGPDGADATLRPNQLLAVALPLGAPDGGLLTAAQSRAVVDVCARQLLTSVGLRTLPVDDPRYHGRYNGDRRTRDTAYHQGTVWGWLIGPFVSAHLKVYADKAQARACLAPLLRASDQAVGTLSEVFDADPPHAAYACLAQAWSVAEALRAWRETEP